MSARRPLRLELDNLGIVEFSASVIEHFERNKQISTRHSEAGGQLFGILASDELTRVLKATGPRVTDVRSRHRYEPDRVTEQIEIRDQYDKGLHFLGDWHTHPQDHPTPSDTDVKSMKQLVHESAHDLPGFILVIVGRAEFPNGLHISHYARGN